MLDSKVSKITEELSVNWWFQESFTIEEDAVVVCMEQSRLAYVVVFLAAFYASLSTIDSNSYTLYTFLQFPFRLFRIYWFFFLSFPRIIIIFTWKETKISFKMLYFQCAPRLISMENLSVTKCRLWRNWLWACRQLRVPLFNSLCNVFHVHSDFFYTSSWFFHWNYDRKTCLPTKNISYERTYMHKSNVNENPV